MEELNATNIEGYEYESQDILKLEAIFVVSELSRFRHNE